MEEKQKITPKNVIRTILIFAILIIFFYIAGQAVGEGISYLK